MRHVLMMIIITACALFFSWTDAVSAQPTMEEVYLFPERFAGQTLILDAWMDAEITRDNGLFFLRVKTRRGKLLSSQLNPFEGMTFTVSESMAESIVKDKDQNFSPGMWMGVRLTCRMEQKNVQFLRERKAWICHVSSIGMLTKDGDVMELVEGSEGYKAAEDARKLREQEQKRREKAREQELSRAEKVREVNRWTPETALKISGSAGSNLSWARVQSIMSSQWEPPPIDRAGKAYTMIVKFRIQRDGTIHDVVVQQSSGNAYFDMAGQRAVLRPRVLPVFPADMADSYKDVEMVFRVGESVE